MGRRVQQVPLQRHTDAQQAYENMFIITSHQGNANQNHNEIPLYTGKKGPYEKSRNNKFWKAVTKREALYTLGANVDTSSSYGKQYGGFFKNKNKNRLYL